MLSVEINTCEVACVKLLGARVEVEFYYQPFEPADTGPEAQYPGCPEEYMLVRVNGVDVDKYLNSEDSFSESSIIDKLKELKKQN